MEYIERETVVKLFNKWADGYSYIEVPTKDAIACVRVIPAADVRPVVLCKDCYAYRRDKELAEAAYLDPEMYCGLLRCEMGEDSFCSYGKRKEET